MCMCLAWAACHSYRDGVIAPELGCVRDGVTTIIQGFSFWVTHLFSHQDRKPEQLAILA